MQSLDTHTHTITITEQEVLVVLMVCMPIRNCPSLASRTELSCADARRKVKSSFDLFSRTFAAIVAELQTLQVVGFIMAV